MSDQRPESLSPTPPRRPRPGRLSRSADFERAYRRGHSAGNRYLVLHIFPREGDDEPRLGVSVSRRIGGAVVRNRIKRLLREAFRASPELAPGHDYVAVARPEAGGLAEREGLAGIERALGELLRRRGERGRDERSEDPDAGSAEAGS